MPINDSRVLRTQEMLDLIGVSRTTLWRWERKGVLPPKRRIGPNVIGWFESEVLGWLRSRPDGSGAGPEDLLWNKEET